ncbi:hypothetical protein DY000_02004376 [Brassica cretica]|uniref:Uncharacterized protein n=1 Tax=Brassica cretica TaxID=69181 RepID=A0ABQ7C3F0_BRACR|nr:hypothetical protein DY000_02004376 [Brassica cretica]
MPDAKPRPATRCGPSFNPSLRVCNLIDAEAQGWNIPKIQTLISHDDIPLIKSPRLPRAPLPDGYCWAPTKSGTYTVQSGNDKLFNGNDTPPLDIVQIAISEACNWRLGQILQNFPEEEEALPSTIAQPLGP